MQRASDMGYYGAVSDVDAGFAPGVGVGLGAGPGFNPRLGIDATGGPRADVDVSLIVPAHNEEGNIRAFYDATVEAFADYQGTYEIVFVDDGSPDDTYRKMVEVAEMPDVACRVTVVSFSRNFGKEAGLVAGLEHARGRYMGFIDSDLQQHPATFREMYELLLANPDYDCVAAYQEQRKNSALRNWFSRRFYGLLERSSNMDVVNNASDFRVFRREVGQALLAMPERNRFTKGLFAWVGFKTLPFPYTPEDRLSGETKWSFKKLVHYAIDGLMSFSTFPLKLALYLGLLASCAAVVYLLYEVIRRIAFGVDVPGYATIVVLILFFGGLQLLVLGVMGSYLSRTYIQGKERPVYIARSVVTSRDVFASRAADSRTRRRVNGLPSDEHLRGASADEGARGASTSGASPNERSRGER